jgi:hypothetical protein
MRCFALALAAILVWTGLAPAQRVVVRAPFTNVNIGARGFGFGGVSRGTFFRPGFGTFNTFGTFNRGVFFNRAPFFSTFGYGGFNRGLFFNQGYGYNINQAAFFPSYFPSYAQTYMPPVQLLLQAAPVLTYRVPVQTTYQIQQQLAPVQTYQQELAYPPAETVSYAPSYAPSYAQSYGYTPSYAQSYSQSYGYAPLPVNPQGVSPVVTSGYCGTLANLYGGRGLFFRPFRFFR